MRSLAEVRDKIDEVDRQIINLLAERSRCSQRVSELKKDEGDIVAPEREKMVYEARRAWASENGLNPDFAERIYRLIIEHSVEIQREQIKNRHE